MQALPYTIVIEPTDDPAFWSYFSPDLPGYTGSGSSFLDAVRDAVEGIPEFLGFLRDCGHDVPPPNPEARIEMYDVFAARQVGAGLAAAGASRRVAS